MPASCESDADISKSELSKIIRIDIKTIELIDSTRQLLAISDITHILHYEKKKIKHNFQQ